jgi:hypothetical protein
MTASPFRLKAPVTPEDQLQETVARALTILVMPPAAWTHFPAGSVPLPPQFAAKLNRFGLQRGWPDFLIVHRGIFGIELKRADGRLSITRTVRTRRGALRVLDGQREVFPRLLEAGFAGIAVCRSLDEVLAALQGWGVPLRAAAMQAPHLVLRAGNEAPGAL